MFRIFIWVLVLLLSTGTISSLYALPYPIATPSGETPGGLYRTYFDNIFSSEINCDSNSKFVAGFTSNGTPICKFPVSTGLYVTGQTLGDTLRFDGSAWVRNSLLFNNGTYIGIVNTSPGYPLDVGGTANFIGFRMPTGAQSGAVLTSDSGGVGRWSTTPAITASGIVGGTQDYVIKWGPGGMGLVLSQIFDNGTSVGIGTITPNASYKLDVMSDILVNGLRMGRGGGSILSNTVLGWNALGTNATANQNVALGYSSLSSLVAGGNNIALGNLAGFSLTNASNNILIGNNVQTTTSTSSNELNIGNWIYGKSGSIGVGTSTPGAKLEIAGQIKITGGSPSVGRFLTTDATGLASWADVTATQVTATGVIGGTEYYLPKFGGGGNGLYASRIYEAVGGNIGLGTALPGYTFDVSGTGNFLGLRMPTGAGSGMVLTSDVSGNARWSSTPTITANGIVGSSGNYLTYFGSGGIGLFSSNTFFNGTQYGINNTNPQYMFDVLGSGSIIRAGSGICIGMTQTGCLDDWSDLNDIVKSKGNPNYIAKFDSGGVINNSQLYETGGNLYIGDIAGILAGNATIAKITIESPVSTNSSNPFITLSEMGGQECRMWITGSQKIGSNCQWAGGVVGFTFNPYQIIMANSAGTDLVGANIYNSPTGVGIGTSSPSTNLHVSGSTLITGNLTVNGKIITDTIVNRTVNNISISGSLLPDSSAPLIYRDIGSSTQKWNNLYLSGQITIAGGGVGSGRVLMSNANGLASWVNYGPYPCTPGGTGINNFCYGIGALQNNTTGGSNVAIGYFALNRNTTASNNSALGEYAGSNLIGSSNITIGQLAGKSAVGNDNNIIGVYAGRTLSGSRNNVFGKYAGNIIGDNNNAIGHYALNSGQGDNNNIFGSEAGWELLGSSNNVFGFQAATYLKGNQNNLIGQTAGKFMTGSANVGIGSTVGFSSSGTQNVFIGYFAGSTFQGSLNTIIGSNAGSSSQGNNNAFYGYYAGISAKGNSNVLIGDATAQTLSGINNIALGSLAGNAWKGDSNIALGRSTLYNGTGSYNLALGGAALSQLTTGEGNAGIGYSALTILNAGNYNVALGWNAGVNLVTGTGNIAIGQNTNYPSANASNQLNIGNIIYGTGLVGGGAGNIGIGTSTPGTKLEIAGQVKITGGSPGAGKVLTSDASGLATWSSTLSGATATGITGGIQNYVTKFGTGGNGLYASQIFDNGTSIAIGTGNTSWAKLVIDSGVDDDSGLRLARIDPNSALTANGVVALGVDASGKVLPISPISNIAVYTGVLRTTSLSPNPDLNTFQITYDFNQYFAIPGKQSFVVSKGDGSSYNGPYFTESGASPVCSWNGTYGSSPLDCATNGPDRLSASPWNSFTMTAKGDTFGYQLALGARGDAPLFARSGRFNGSQTGGLYTNDSPYQTPSPWQRVLSVPANHPEYLYINTGYNSQLQAQSGGGNVGIGTTTPQSRFEVWNGATTSSLIHFRGTNNVAIGSGAIRPTTLTTGKENTALGNESLYFIQNGLSNTAVGYKSLRTTTSGQNNTALGQETLVNNGIGSWNTALGYMASWSNTSGTGNIGIGPQAVYYNAVGNHNIGIGYQAIRGVTGNSTSYNIGIGYQALLNVTAGNNIAIGQNVGDTLASGTNNILIGNSVDTSSTTASNELNIGNWIYGSGGNIGIGVSSPISKLDVGGTFELGINGTQLNSIIKATVVKDVPSLATTVCSTQTFTITNAQTTGSVMISPASALNDRMYITYARVSAANTVEAKFCNESAGTIDLSSMNYYITVIQ